MAGPLERLNRLSGDSYLESRRGPGGSLAWHAGLSDSVFIAASAKAWNLWTAISCHHGRVTKLV